MFRKLFSTTGTLASIAIINFSLMIFISNVLGKEGVSVYGLLVLGISFVVLTNNLIGGGALVYMTPRYPKETIIGVSYVWALFSTLGIGFLLYALDLVPVGYLGYLLVAALFECMLSIHIQVLLGQAKVEWHNALKIGQKVSLLILFLFFGITMESFLFSLVIANGLCFWISFFLLNYTTSKLCFWDKAMFVKLFNYGFQIQSSNIVQLLNYRLLYVFIEKSLGSVLGVYIVAIQLSESLWIPSKGLSIIQYSTLVNEKEEEKRQAISLRFLKLSVVLTGIALLVLLLIPERSIGWVFGKDFNGVKVLLFALSTGVLAMSCNQIFSHYFSGSGIYKYNVMASVLGFVVVGSLGWYAIEEYQLVGAGLVTSLSYVVSTVYLGYLFFRETRFSFKDFMLTKNDVLAVFKRFK